MRKKLTAISIFIIAAVLCFTSMAYAEDGNNPAPVNSTCNTSVDFDSDNIGIDLNEKGTGEFKVKNAEGPLTFIINTTAVEIISFEDEGETFSLKGVKDTTFTIKDEKKTKEITIKENTKCKPLDITPNKTFKLVTEGNSMPVSAEINAKNIKAFAWDKDNVFFANADAPETVKKNITVNNSKGKPLDYYQVAQGEFKVVPDERIFIAPRDEFTFTIQGGKPPYRVTSSKPWLTGIMDRSAKNTFTITNALSVGESATLTFWDESENKKTVQVDVTTDGTEPDFTNDRFLFNLGVTFLNPYVINSDDGAIEDNDIESNYFIELIYKDRNAWLGKPETKNSLVDFEGRIGYGIASSEEGNTITGASYGDLSVGYTLIWFQKGICADKVGGFPWTHKVCKTPPEIRDRFTFNLEFIYGFATDQKYKMIHRYYGYGPVLVYGLPLEEKHNRMVEAIFGAYRGHASTPVLKEDDHNFVKSESKKPMFREPNAWLLRADFRVPVRQSQYLSIAGRYFFIEDDDAIDSWNVTAAVSFRIDKWVDGLLSFLD